MREPDHPRNLAEKGKQGRAGADNDYPRTARDFTRRKQSRKREHWPRREHDQVGEGGNATGSG